MYTVTLKLLPHPDTCNRTGPVIAAVVVPIIAIIIAIIVITVTVAIACHKSKHA